MDDLDASREMVERFDEEIEKKAIRTGEWEKPDENPRELESGRGHLRGTRYRGKTKHKRELHRTPPLG